MDFKYGSINFCKYRKQTAKYQYLGIAPLVVIEISWKSVLF